MEAELSSIPFSVLDLAPVRDGGTVTESFRNTLDLARRAEALGYRRYWLAEHHNMTGIASAATAVLIGHVAGGTTSIRVGAGGVMLPNHSPLVVAEQFGTLEALYPGRIDLGLGRAPGTDQLTMRALRRNRVAAEEDFPRDVAELLSYFAPARPGQSVRAVPGEGLNVPVWLLGSSLYSAGLAALIQAMQKVEGYGGKFMLSGLQETVRSIFEISRLDQVFQIFPDADAALVG